MAERGLNMAYKELIKGQIGNMLKCWSHFCNVLAIVRMLLLYQKVIQLIRALIWYIAENYATKIERYELNFKGEL